MKPDEQLWQENQQLREQRDDARRWARAWKMLARVRRALHQDALLNFEEAMWQFDEQQRRACEAEERIKALQNGPCLECEQLREQITVLKQRIKTLQGQLMDRPPAMQRQLEFRPCAHPDCKISARVDKHAPPDEPCYCAIHARGSDHETD